MKNALTVTYLIAPLSIGLIIGGLIAGTNAWIWGLVILVLDIIVGSILKYNEQPATMKNSQDNASCGGGFTSNTFNYVQKVQRIYKDPTAMEEFTVSEIVDAIVNLLEAKMVLSYEEFSLVYQLYNHCRQDHTKMVLSKFTFFFYCYGKIANFDLIAPYHMYCGDESMADIDDKTAEKHPYRQKAKEIILHNGFNSVEWKELCDDFFDRFYLNEMG